MLHADSQDNARPLVINGRNYDAVGFAFDRNNLAEAKRLCSTMKLPAPWRAAVREWARCGGEFLIMYADAAGYDEGEPAVMIADDAHDFDRSIHGALTGVLARTFYWASCLEQPHEDQLRLAIYVYTYLSGTA